MVSSASILLNIYLKRGFPDRKIERFRFLINIFCNNILNDNTGRRYLYFFLRKKNVSTHPGATISYNTYNNKNIIVYIIIYTYLKTNNGLYTDK